MKRSIFFILLMTFLMLCSFITAWLRIRTFELGYTIGRLHKEIIQLQQRRNLLEAKVAQLKSPAHLLAQKKRLHINVVPPEEWMK